MKRKVCLMVLIGMLLGGQAQGMDSLGSPIATEQSSLGFEYGSESFCKVETGRADVGDYAFDVSKAYVTGIYGNDQLSLFLKGGAVWASAKDATPYSLSGLLEDGDGFGLAGGLKATLRRSADIDWGIIGQAGYMSVDMDPVAGSYGPYPVRLTGGCESWYAEVAAGPNVYLTENHKLFLFGGGIVGWHRTVFDFEADIAGYTSNVRILKNTLFGGGYVGIQGEIAKGLTLFGEYQYAVLFNGFFVGAEYRF